MGFLYLYARGRKDISPGFSVSGSGTARFGRDRNFYLDHNKERAYERTEAILDRETEDMVSGVAFHWYSGDHFEALNLIRQIYPDKKLILSESCLEFGKYEKRHNRK